MQKKLIALAVAGLISAPVFAQSNVTIYGIVDAGVGYGEFGDNDFRGIVGGVLSGSRIGFRGTEDLGNGLKAVFQLENGFDVGTGVGGPAVAVGGDRDSVFSRQAWVGLQGAFGTVGLGRQYAPGFAQQYDVTQSMNMGPQSLLSALSGMTITPNSGARWDNSVSYDGSFAGLKARAIYAARGVENSFQNPDLGSPTQDDAWGLGLEYANGPLKVGGVYHNVGTGGGIGVSGDDQKEWSLGASYNFGILTVAGSYQDAKDLGATDMEADLWQLGIALPIGAAGQVQLAYGELDRENGSDELGADSWTVAYTHAVSKRTTAYAVFNRTNNDDDTGAFRAAPGDFLTDGTTGDNGKLLAVGVRHAF